MTRLHLEIEDEGGIFPAHAADLVRACAASAVRTEGIDVDAAVSLFVTDDDSIHETNRQYRGVDRATDVLSFPTVNYPAGKTAKDCGPLLKMEYDDELKGAYLGDIIISMDHARAQAEEYGHSLDRELGYLTTHAMFHLMGYDHMQEDEKRVMRSMEERALKAIGLTREDEFHG